MDYDKARAHNLSLRILKHELNIDKATTLDKKFTNTELSEKLFFREKDFKIMEENRNLFVLEGDKYSLSEDNLKRLLSYKEKHLLTQETYDDKAEEEFKQLFKEIKDALESENAGDFKLYEANYEKNSPKLIVLVDVIHWFYLPEYEEYMLENRGCFPEDNLKEYYNHYHSLEDLYEFLICGKKKKNSESKLGDINLNQDVKFTVFSRRWGHDDIYTVKRTIDGWSVKFSSSVYNSGNKNGDAIIRCLEHDNISYPTGIDSIFEEFWDEADSTEMSFSKLEVNLKKIAKWIHDTESNKPRFTWES